ncbi:MAG: Clp protease N-terminal domain-containing protein [Terriglobales bacterium]
MLSGELELYLNHAFRQARGARHEFITVEDLLLAILEAPKVREVLEGCGADLEQLGGSLKQYIETHSFSSSEAREAQPTLAFQRVLQRAVFHVQSSGKKEVSVLNVLVAIFSEKQSHAALELAHAQVRRLDVVNFMIHGLAMTDVAAVRSPRAHLDAAGLDRLVELLIALKDSIDQATRLEDQERIDVRELIDDVIATARAERPNEMKLRGLLVGLSHWAAAKVELQPWRQVRDTAIALDLWIIE